MAKPQKKPDTLRARKSIPAKSPSRKTPAAKPAARPLVRASTAKAPPAKSRAVTARGGKPAPPKSPARKTGKPAAADLPRSIPRKGSSAPEQPPATEAQIVEALAGKLSGPAAGSRAGLSWLAAPSKSHPEVVEPPSIPARGPIVEEVIIADVVVVELKVEEPENLNVATPNADEPPPDPLTEASNAEVAAPAEPKAEEPKAAASETGAPELKEWLARAAANEQSLSKRIRATASRIGWSLTIQAALFVAFCVMAAKDAPLSGLQNFLRGGIPLFAMILICIDLTSLGGAQRMLDTLEGERLVFQRLQRMLPDPAAGANLETKPDSFAAARRLAHLPSLIILGILLVVWLCLGLTVWFL